MEDSTGALIILVGLLILVIIAIVKVVKWFKRTFKKAKRKVKKTKQKIDKVQKDYAIGKHSPTAIIKRGRKELRKNAKQMLAEAERSTEENDSQIFGEQGLDDNSFEDHSREDQESIKELEDIFGK